MKLRIALFAPFLLAALTLAPAASNADVIYNYSSSSSGSWIDANLGNFSFTESGVTFSGTKYGRTITRTSSSYLTSVALPVSLPTWSSTIYYLALDSGDSVFISGFGVASNVIGDSLTWSYTTHALTGMNFNSAISFTGGTGAYAGAFGDAITYGAYFQSSINSVSGTRNWVTEAHLAVPSPVPEPASLTLVLLGAIFLSAAKFVTKMPLTIS